MTRKLLLIAPLLFMHFGATTQPATTSKSITLNQYAAFFEKLPADLHPHPNENSEHALLRHQWYSDHIPAFEGSKTTVHITASGSLENIERCDASGLTEREFQLANQSGSNNLDAPNFDHWRATITCPPMKFDTHSSAGSSLEPVVVFAVLAVQNSDAVASLDLHRKIKVTGEMFDFTNAGELPVPDPMSPHTHTPAAVAKMRDCSIVTSAK